jgi:hypothetical protein
MKPLSEKLLAMVNRAAAGLEAIDTCAPRRMVAQAVTGAQGQKTNYTYDSYGRLTQTQHIMVADRRPPTVSITSAATPPAASRR